jgi:hypothetical protein
VRAFVTQAILVAVGVATDGRGVQGLGAGRTVHGVLGGMELEIILARVRQGNGGGGTPR